MNDTSPGAQRRFDEDLLALSGIERLKLGCAMFDDARRLMLAGIRASGVPAEGPVMHEALVRRLYGEELGPGLLAAIIALLRRGS
ncbi:MAG: hypothetical protein WC728_05815 [Elusimicrobiota bacterium]